MESAALLALKASLGDDFVATIKCLLDCRGRLIITGMGKSGLIGRKLAATFSSTGTPAYFVHPGEASHGDMGMVLDTDIVMAISNSGETAELRDITNYCQRHAIVLIAITKKADSTLARYATHTLLLPDYPEACPMGLAPTTSTTATLALGDALAVCLLQARQFDSSSFRQLHPGGKLGQSLLTVEHVMRLGDSMPLVKRTASMKEVLIKTTEKNLGCVGVTEASSQVLCGLITDGDIRRWIEQGGTLDDHADSVMTNDPIMLPANSVIGAALNLFETKRINGAFVGTPQTVPQGFVHVHDCLG
ncbi:MAG: KpsF/GutQ family sugar-phosphate isomerase [Alphaproteobacteria bacterium]|nr:KpsF/GutQ family sugar-phosphate isomerase [Alphaproteobacteria bacterium]